MIPFCGVDMTNIRTEEERYNYRPDGWEIWESKMMGLTDFPYHECQAVTWANGIALGDRHNPNNPFGWDIVITNLLET